MVENSNPQELAQAGLRQIEDAILRLLDANPQGLRNVDVARTLSLRSDFPERRRDFLTYSVLGGLLERGSIVWDQESKLFFSHHRDVSTIDEAQSGLRQIENAIIELLESHPEGLRNADIANALDLRSDFRGRQRDFLTYSILGGLVTQCKVVWDAETKLFSLAVP